MILSCKSLAIRPSRPDSLPRACLSMLQARRLRSIYVERIDGTWDAAEGKGFQIRTADAGRIHHKDGLGDRLIGGTESVGRLHDHNLAVKRFDAMAAKEFRIYRHGRSLGHQNLNLARLQNHGSTH